MSALLERTASAATEDFESAARERFMAVANRRRVGLCAPCEKISDSNRNNDDLDD